MPAPVHYHQGQFPPVAIEWEKLIPLIGSANAALARYDGLLSAIPNASVLLSPLTTQEAVLSSRIEGTQATMGEVLEVEAGGDPEGMTGPRRADAEEVLNYRRAMRITTAELESRPLSQHLLRQAHAVLMEGVRGRDKAPGGYRRQQNWIGEHQCPIEEASFVPVPQIQLAQGMDDWERYLLRIDVLDPLVQLALTHVEFEALHPFEDGNGRLGRMLIPLFLFSRRLLSGPHFYVSAYFEQRRDEYYDRLRAVSRSGEWTAWCAFFLEALRTQAMENEVKARLVLGLYERVKLQVVDATHSQHAIRAVDFLFQTPIFKGPDFTAGAGIPRPTATRILGLLREAGLLTTLREGRGRRPGFFAFRDLLNVAEGQTVF